MTTLNYKVKRFCLAYKNIKTSLQLQRTINIRKTLIKFFIVVSKVSSFMGNPICRIEVYLSLERSTFIELGNFYKLSSWKIRIAYLSLLAWLLASKLIVILAKLGLAALVPISIYTKQTGSHINIY